MASQTEVQLTGFKPGTKQRILNSEVSSVIRHHLPERLQLRSSWELKYSLEQNGSSLKTLYELAQPAPNGRQHGYILAVKDAKGGVFGAYVNEPLQPSGGRYHGNGDCFLWKASHGSGAVFPYTGVNEFMIFCTHHFLSFGGGDGHYGLWLDDSLAKGVTYPCLTYSNEVLSSEGSKFNIIALEVWEI